MEPPRLATSPARGSFAARATSSDAFSREIGDIEVWDQVMCLQHVRLLRSTPRSALKRDRARPRHSGCPRRRVARRKGVSKNLVDPGRSGSMVRASCLVHRYTYGAQSVLHGGTSFVHVWAATTVMSANRDPEGTSRIPANMAAPDGLTRLVAIRALRIETNTSE